MKNNATVIERVKPQIRALSNYQVRELGPEIIKMDKNENPYDLPDDIRDEILESVSDKSWSRYPPIVALDLYEQISKYTGWRKDGIVAGNGSDEIIMTFMNTFMEPGKKLVIPAPSFPMFKYMGILVGADIVEVPLTENFEYDCDTLEEAFLDGGDMLIICSPNNPTGTLFPIERLRPVLEKSTAPVIMDEAYYEFSKVTALDLVEEFPNLVIFRTFSKAFSLAGLRLGYALMAPELAVEVGKVKLPFNVDTFSITAACKALENHEKVLSSLEILKEERDKLYAEMQKLDDVRVYPTASNFILFKTPYDSKELCDGIVSEGVLVRDLSANPALKNTLRITVSTPDDNKKFLNGLIKALENMSQKR